MTDDGKFFLYPCGSCPVYYRSTNQRMALRLLQRHEQGHRHDVIMRISTGGRPEHGAIRALIPVALTGLGLFGWGFSNGARTPDGRFVAAIAILGLMVLLFSTGIVRYRRRERVDAARTKKLEKGLRQDMTGVHIWDGA